MTRLEHGWIQEDGTYLCDGCNVRPPHEHRCHGSDWSLTHMCGCKMCKEPNENELAAFLATLK